MVPLRAPRCARRESGSDCGDEWKDREHRGLLPIRRVAVGGGYETDSNRKHRES